MDGRGRLPRSPRLPLSGAPVPTMLCLGIAALASCQPFRDDDAGFHAPLMDFAEYDACVARGGRWLVHTHRCSESLLGDAEP